MRVTIWNNQKCSERVKRKNSTELRYLLFSFLIQMQEKGTSIATYDNLRCDMIKYLIHPISLSE
jgi:hypothetical protein